jgi:hypothetical protein
MSDPQCSATYKGVKPAKAPKAPRAKKLTKKEQRENITMSMEDKPAPARKEALGDIFESATPFEEFNSPTVRAILKNKGSLNKALDKKIADQQGMLAEDINRALPDTKGKAKGKAGRPSKYANAEEARQAKIANTIRRAKERVVEKKDTKLSARIARAKKEWEDWAEGLEEPRGNVSVDGNGNRRENQMIIDRVERQKKRFPSLKLSDWYRPLVLKRSSEKNQTVALPAELTGKGFNVGADITGGMVWKGATDPEFYAEYMKSKNAKTGGMLSWVKSVIGRHPQLTRQQIEQAERFADSLMADPRGITFEGASVIPIDVRKELAQEFYNRQTMAKEDKDAPANPAEAFADEVRKQYEAQKKKGKGRMSGGFGFNDFVSGLNKLNPVMWGIQNHPEVGIKLGQVTNDTLLPAVVNVGKPVYDATAIATGTALTGNPLLGKAVGDIFWKEFGEPYDPRNRQHESAIKEISERVGKKAGEKASDIAEGKGRPRKPRGGATALQKGLSAEMRSYTRPPLQHDLNQIIHSNDAPHTKFGQTPNAFRDFTNSFDPKAQKKIEKAIQVLASHGVITPPQMRPTAPVFVPKPAPKLGKGADYGHLWESERRLNSPFLTGGLGEDPRTWSPIAHSGLVRDPEPIFTADWRGPEVQQQRRDAYNAWKARQGGSVLGDYGSVVNHLMSHITDPHEPIDPRDFIQAIHLIKGIKRLKGGMSAEDFFRHITQPRSGMGYYGGADQPQANTPDDYYAVDPPVMEDPNEDNDWGMGAIDWGAIGQALMDDALDQQQPHQGDKNAEEP